MKLIRRGSINHNAGTRLSRYIGKAKVASRIERRMTRIFKISFD